MCGQEWTLLPSEGRKIVSGGYADSAWTIVAGPNKTAGSYLESATIPNVIASCQITEVFFIDRDQAMCHSIDSFRFDVLVSIIRLEIMVVGQQIEYYQLCNEWRVFANSKQTPPPPSMCPWHPV